MAHWMLLRAPLAMKTLHKKLILLYCSSSSDSREIAAWQGHFDGSGHESARLCICKVQPGLPQRLAPCPNGCSQVSGTRRKNTFRSHGCHQAIAEIKLEAICTCRLLAKVVLFWENMLPNDCFAAGDTNPSWRVVLVPLCLSGYNLASLHHCVYRPCIQYIYWLYIYHFIILPHSSC